jgi:hypothetical protein
LNVKKVKPGLALIEDSIAPVLFKAWKSGFTTNSDFARQQANWVAMAASMQLITTRVSEGIYSRDWQITGKGIRLLNELEWIDDREDYDTGC